MSNSIELEFKSETQVKVLDDCFLMVLDDDIEAVHSNMLVMSDECVWQGEYNYW